ncbi:MAG: M23 family metallopeptidase [Pseudomonadota bacterium]
MLRASLLLLSLVLLPACGSWRVVRSRAVHHTTVRTPVKKAQSDVVARSPSSLRGEPLAYELEQARFSWPIAGGKPISSSFGERWGRQHEGIDIAASSGTPVKAARAGKVIYAENRISGYGNMVIIRHSPSFATVYAHLSRIGVRPGDFVDRGKIIGKVGMTGRATSAHLHFEIRHKRMAVDPLMYLPGQVRLSSLKSPN